MSIETEKQKFTLISSVGTGGRLNLLQASFYDLNTMQLLDGVEAGHLKWAFYWANSNAILRYEQKNPSLPILGLHAQYGYGRFNGPINTAFSNVVNTFIEPVRASIELASQLTHCRYALTHEGTVNNAQKRLKIAQALQGQDLMLMIEINPHSESLKNCLKITRELINDGVKTGLVIDLYHLLASYGSPKNFETNWTRLISEIKSLLDGTHLTLTLPPGLASLSYHLPFGTDQKDSLPFSRLTTRHFNDIADILETSYRCVGLMYTIIENAAYPTELFPLLTKGRLENFSFRNGVILRQLADHYIIA